MDSATTEHAFALTALLVQHVSALSARMIAGKEVRVNRMALASVTSIGVLRVQGSISVAIQKITCLMATAGTLLLALIHIQTAASLLAKMTATGTVCARRLGVFAILDGLVQVAINHHVHSTADHTVSVKMERALAGIASLALVVNGTLQQRGLVAQHAALPSHLPVMALQHACPPLESVCCKKPQPR